MATAEEEQEPPTLTAWTLPTLPVLVLYELFKQEESGRPLSPEDQQTWESYQDALAAVEHRRSLLGLVDLGEVMEEGTTDPEMLVPKLLVKSEHHYVYGNKESMKTWLMLVCAAKVMVSGDAVLWVDKEMGRKNLANRFLALGVPSDVVREHFIYLEHPAMNCSKESTSLWTMVVQHREPALVVVDAQTEVLADAGLNENSGTDIEKWSQAYITPARRLGCTTVMIDHTGHEEKGRPVGSRQKGASAKVELSVRTLGLKANRDRTGSVVVRCTKNTVSADVPEEQSYRMGGDGSGRFLIEEAAVPVPVPAGAGDALDGMLMRDKVLLFLRSNTGISFSVSQLRDEKLGTSGNFRKVLDQLVDDEDEPVTCVKSPDKQDRGGRWAYNWPG